MHGSAVNITARVTCIIQLSSLLWVLLPILCWLNMQHEGSAAWSSLLTFSPEASQDMLTLSLRHKQKATNKTGKQRDRSLVSEVQSMPEQHSHNSV